MSKREYNAKTLTSLAPYDIWHLIGSLLKMNTEFRRTCRFFDAIYLSYNPPKMVSIGEKAERRLLQLTVAKTNGEHNMEQLSCLPFELWVSVAQFARYSYTCDHLKSQGCANADIMPRGTICVDCLCIQSDFKGHVMSYVCTQFKNAVDELPKSQVPISVARPIDLDVEQDVSEYAGYFNTWSHDDEDTMDGDYDGKHCDSGCIVDDDVVYDDVTVGEGDDPRFDDYSDDEDAAEYVYQTRTTATNKLNKTPNEDPQSWYTSG